MTSCIAKFGVILLIISTISCDSPSDDIYTLTSDFDHNKKIFLVFMPEEPIVELISILSQYENLGIIVAHTDDISNAERTLIASGTLIKNIEFFAIPKLDIWIRDNGPAIIKNRNGKLKAVDFRSNMIEFENNDKDIANVLRVPLVRSKLRSVGGTRESNGEGIVLMMEGSFGDRVNEKKKKHIEKELEELCGVDHVVWMKKGLVEDEIFDRGPIYQNIYPVGTGGHIDEFCRFVNKNTVLLAKVPDEDVHKHPIYKANSERLEENYTILKAFKKHEINVIRIPTAEMMFDKYYQPRDGKLYDIMIMASYLNFVIGNNVILAAKYFEEGQPESVKKKDDEVKRILQELFPNHVVVQANPKHLNSWGGGYHCWTYNFPEDGPVE